MHVKEKLLEVANRILAHFKDEASPTQARTLDGQLVEWSDEILKAGAEFYVLGEEGKKSAADGDYELENGDIVKVQGGRVSDVLFKQHEEMNDFNPQEFSDNLISKVTEVFESKLSALETKANEQAEKIVELEAKLAENKSNEVTEVLSAVTSLKEEIGKMSVETPSARQHAEFSEENKYTAFLKSINKNK